MRTIAAAIIALALAVILGYWRGYESQSATVDALKDQMKAANAVADIELKQANADVQERQKLLDAAAKQMEGSHDEAKVLRADLAAARKRLSVTIAAGSCRSTEQAQSSGSASLGNGPAITADIDPAVAARLVELTDTGDQAIRRLNACITQYRAAQDAMR